MAVLIGCCDLGCGGDSAAADREAPAGSGSETGGIAGLPTESSGRIGGSDPADGTGGGSGSGSAGASGGETNSGTGGRGGTGDGQVTPPFEQYCVATFTQDYASFDAFGELVFTARAGERYLMGSYGHSFGYVAEMLFLTPTGPAAFEVELDDAGGTAPFVTDCVPDASAPYYAVFMDVTVYAEASMTTELCTLAAGTVLPVDARQNYGFALETFGSGTEPSIYSIFLNAFSAQCGGAEVGYVATPTTEVFGSTTVLVPITDLIGPA